LGDIDYVTITNIINKFLPELKAAMKEHIPDWDQIKKSIKIDIDFSNN